MTFWLTRRFCLSIGSLPICLAMKAFEFGQGVEAAGQGLRVGRRGVAGQGGAGFRQAHFGGVTEAGDGRQRGGFQFG